MKTQLIQLDSYDNLVSIRDKMMWAKTPRMLLIWPRKGKGRVALRPLDLTLLRRHAESLGAQLGLVTGHGEMRQAARALGIPVFASAAKAQKADWPARAPSRPQRRAPRANLRALRQAHLPQDLAARLPRLAQIGVFAAGVLAVLAILLTFLPTAQVRITPPTQEQTITFTVRAGPENIPSLAGDLPSRAAQIRLTETASLPVSGQGQFPAQPASGEVEFSNLTSQPVEIPAGTPLLTRAGVRFETVESVSLPAGLGQTTGARIRATRGGVAGNVAQGEINAFESPLGLSATVRNPQPTSGGTDETLPTATEQDRARLREQTLQTLRQKAAESLRAQTHAGDMWLDSSLELVQIEEETYTPGPGQPGIALTLRLSAAFRAFYVAESDLRDLSTRILDSSTPAGFTPLADSLRLKAVSSTFGGEAGVARWEAQASRRLEKTVDGFRAARLIRGQSLPAAQSTLAREFGLQAVPEIHIQPAFWRWLPLLPFRIGVSEE